MAEDDEWDVVCLYVGAEMVRIKYPTLLAKKWNQLESKVPPEETHLVKHLATVAQAGEEIWACVGGEILASLGLPKQPWFTRFQKALHVACWLHDIGKANTAFQEIVQSKRSPWRQPLRHELISGILLLHDGAIRTWALERLEDSDQEITYLLLQSVIGAILGHHVKMDIEWRRAATAIHEGGTGTELRVLLGHPDLRHLFGSSGDMVFSLIDGRSNYVGQYRLAFQKGHVRWRRYVKRNEKWRRFAACLKALLMAADAVGSALLPRRTDISKWISETLGQRLQPGDALRVARDRLQGNKPRPFQERIAESTGRVTLAEAGCGTGKTVGAYLWAERNALNRKLFFCYPTTGTATEGYLGYVAESNVEAELMHSRAVIDLEDVVSNGEDTIDERIEKVESLKAWGPQVTVCTVDTVLGLVRNHRRGLYNSPSLLSASFVFDEIHAYDERLFAGMLALIKALPGARFLLMSASLPVERREALARAVSEISYIEPPIELERIPRYQFHWAESHAQVWKRVEEVLAQRHKVLWVTNTVRTAQLLYEEVRSRGMPTLTYHSRFKYMDRKEKHQRLMRMFASDMPVVAIVTQVAEMSLDIDADMLITEMAPIPSLIQRLGRLNRRVTPDSPGFPREAWFLAPDSHMPYTVEELEVAKEWVQTLVEKNKPLSQSDLSAEFNALHRCAALRLTTQYTEWLDGGWLAEAGSTRLAGYTVPVIMKEDFEKMQSDPKALIRYAFPMPLEKKRMDGWDITNGHFISPEGAIDYDAGRGAKWRNE